MSRTGSVSRSSMRSSAFSASSNHCIHTTTTQRPETATPGEFMPSTSANADWRTPTVVLICGGLVLTLAMGVRHGFGLFLLPMCSDLYWGRETFALALAVQNLVWGATQPFTGMFADKYGSGRVVLGGALLYVLGLL